MYFDAHSDIWCDVTTRRLNGETNVFDRCHLERLRKGGVEGSIFVIWVDPPYDVDYVKRTEQIMAAAKAEIAECQSFRIVHTYDEMMKANADGKIYIFIGIEGMAAMGKDLSWIDRYYDFGCRHGILTWNEANELGAGALSGKDYGLTETGKEAVRRMQEKGMMLDVSHLNEAGFWDLMKITKKPFIASHSNSRALCDVPRNLTDDQLRAIRDVNGVVGLNAFNLFIDDDPANQTVQRLAEHAAHMIDVMGIDHVGCGFDFFEFIDNPDTMGTMTDTGSPCTKGLANASEIPNLFACFEKMGMSKEDMEKIARLNFQRVVKDAIGSLLVGSKRAPAWVLFFAWFRFLRRGRLSTPPDGKIRFYGKLRRIRIALGSMWASTPTNLIGRFQKSRRGGRLCPPKGSTEFAEDFRVSGIHFAGRTEASHL